MGPHVSGRGRAQPPPTLEKQKASRRHVTLKYPASAALATNTCFALAAPSHSESPSSQQPRDRLPSPHHHQAMDVFPDGGFVRLESRVLRGRYVHADADWVRVSLREDERPGRRGLNSVWRVEHWVSPVNGDTYVLLQNAAYGRYLSFWMKKANTGHRGCRTTQLNRAEPNVLEGYPWKWLVERLEPPDQDYVCLHYFTCYLRANGKFQRWNRRVTADIDAGAPRVTDMMHWTVHQVTASPLSALQDLPVTLEPQGGDTAGVYTQPPRMIRYVRANDEGEFDENDHSWPSFAFYGSSVNELKDEMWRLQDWNEDMSAYTLCMRPGAHGRLMPLVARDLVTGINM